MLDEKSKGKEVTISAPAPERDGKVVDIMEALKRSIGKNSGQKETRHRYDKEEKKYVVELTKTVLSPRSAGAWRAFRPLITNSNPLNMDPH